MIKQDQKQRIETSGTTPSSFKTHTSTTARKKNITPKDIYRSGYQPMRSRHEETKIEGRKEKKRKEASSPIQPQQQQQQQQRTRSVVVIIVCATSFLTGCQGKINAFPPPLTPTNTDKRREGKRERKKKEHGGKTPFLTQAKSNQKRERKKRHLCVCVYIYRYGHEEGLVESEMDNKTGKGEETKRRKVWGVRVIALM